MDALQARERQLLEMDQELEARQRRVMDEADEALRSQDERMRAVLGGASAAPAAQSPPMSPVAVVAPVVAAIGGGAERENDSRKRNVSGPGRATRKGHLSPKEIGPDAVIRLQRAKMKTMAEDLEKAQERIKVLQDQVNLGKKSSAELKEENRKLDKRCSGLEGAREKIKQENSKLRDRVSELEHELIALRREIKATDRSARQAENAGNSKDVRLHRALDEAASLKERLKLVQSEMKSQSDNAQSELKRKSAENQRLERQKQELLAAFRKQLKLIDVLKRQKIHLEAAKMLSFTEDEFQRTLESHP